MTMPYRNERGIALITVLVFTLIAGIAGLAFLSMTSWEYKGAGDRQESMEAFYLADAAIEHARGELQGDPSFRGPIVDAPLGSGTYSLTVLDTTWNGGPARLFRGDGEVGESRRRVEVFARVTASLPPLLVNGDASVNGNLTVDGPVHVNGNADFGPGDGHLNGGPASTGYEIEPPAIRTDPMAFAEGTYYFVQGVAGSDPARAVVRRVDPVLGLVEVGFVESDVVSPSARGHQFRFDQADLSKYFDDAATALFTEETGPVVVNFGETAVTWDGLAWNAAGSTTNDLLFRATLNDYQLHATIINTRFEGPESDRIVPCTGYWVGGTVEMGTKIQFAPGLCVTVIAHDLGPQINAKVSLGTAQNPALTYVTGSVLGLNGDVSVYGTLIALCNFDSAGGPRIHGDLSFVDCLPEALRLEFYNSTAGAMDILEWREAPL